MKYLFTLALILIFSFANAQQVDRQKVIVEVGTGTWCPSCPAVVHIIHDLLNAGAEIAVVKYHINDIYQNAESVTRKIYYDFPWYPTTYYDSNHIGYDDWATYSVHLSYYQDRISTPSSFTVDLGVDNITESSIEGNVSIDKVDAYAGTNLVLHIALTESHIPDNWYGETEVNYAERAMFPDGHGTAIDFSSGDQLVIPFNFDLDPLWVMENMEVTYFIQDNDSKEILQGDFIDVSDYLLGNQDLSDTSKGMVYPNPATDNISIVTENDLSNITKVQIVDITGRIVYENKDYYSAINIHSFKSGIYLITYQEDSILRIAKFIKR